MNILDQINLKSAWGRKEITTLPYGDILAEEMKKANKTNMGSKDIIYLLFGIKAKELNFESYSEFVDMMKLEKTMVGRKRAQELLRNFWVNTNEYYKPYPVVFNSVKAVIIKLNEELKDNNSTQQIRIKFMEHFLVEVGV